MIAILLIFLAGVCKSLADTLAWHFDTCIFRNTKRRDFFEINTQRVRKIKTIGGLGRFSGYPLDAWHISNSIQLTCWLVLPLVYKPILPAWWMDFGAGGLLFIVVFNLFYNKVFR